MMSEQKPTIKHRCTEKVLFEGESGMAMRQVLEKAILSGADLSGADLYGSNLSGARLCGADLSGANLCGSNLSGADLCGADLSGADLSGADLSGARLCGSNLSGANLSGADLYGANLKYAKNCELSIARTRILPEGQLIGWKKCKDDVIVKLQIPAKAKRSSAFGRKCRAEYAKVLQVFGADVGISIHDGKTVYRKGKTVKPDSFSEDWKTECAPGIHFYITRIEAENN